MKIVVLTDLHIGHTNPLQQAAMQELVTAVQRFCPWPTVDGVLILGDIAYSGTEPEYIKVQSSILKPLRAAIQPSWILAVPGNHDVDCDEALPMSWDRIGRKRQERFFFEDDAGRRVRSSRTTAMQAYENFIVGNDLLGLHPSQHLSHAVSVPTLHDSALVIVSTNTALFSDREADVIDRLRTPAPTPSLRQLVATDGFDKDARILVVAHHPIEWFIEDDQDKLKAFLASNRAVYLHGHLHQVRVELGLDGLLSLGFGASYQNAPDSTSPSRYENGFAFIELRDSDLHVVIIGWDSTYGQWQPRTSLPVQMQKVSPLFEFGRVLPLPPLGSSPSALREPNSQSTVGVASIVAINSPPLDWWLKLATHGGLVSNSNSSSPARALAQNAETLTFRVESGGRHQYVTATSASSHVYSKPQFHYISSLLDEGEYANATVITFGTIAGDAEAFAAKVRNHKSFKTVRGSRLVQMIVAAYAPDLAAMVACPPPGVTHRLLVLSPPEGEPNPVVTDTTVLLERREELSNAWFMLYDASATLLPQDSPLIRLVRESTPRLEQATYGSSSNPDAAGIAPEFDRAHYLDVCFNEHNTIRYPALAEVGLRFGTTTLREHYVEAHADEDAYQEAATAAYSQDELAGLSPELRRAHLARRLSQHAVGYRSETERQSARVLYQRHGLLLVLGDPGAGKTCFVKNEILDYCKPPSDDSWYSKHTPVYVPLSEAAGVLAALAQPQAPEVSTTEELINVVSAVLVRQGVSFPKRDLRDAVSSGSIAFFFDGLDEVTPLSSRGAVVQLVESALEPLMAAGNRLVITSRPAAIRLTPISEDFRRVSLRGLSELEIRTLAKRVLQTRVSETPDGEAIHIQPLGSEDLLLVDRIMADCKSIPGVGRLAQNPLLLTLLVAVYANQGPMSAKRHRIYALAAQTLARVRARNAGQRVFSEADLRLRLGQLALFMLDRPAGGLPRLGDVCAFFIQMLPLEFGNDIEEARAFVHEVAVSTGLLRMSGQHTDDQTTVTFMHHSFLEYYAALGVLEADEWIKLTIQYSRRPRWRDVVGLVAGIAGESPAFSDLVDAIYSAQTDEERNIGSRLLFALDCCAECDVPPERAIRRIVEWLQERIDRLGAHDPRFVAALGERFAPVYAASRSPSITDCLDSALHTDGPSLLFWIRLSGRIWVPSVGAEALRSRILAHLGSSDSLVVAAVIEAATVNPGLRSAQFWAGIRDLRQDNAVVRTAVANLLGDAPEATQELGRRVRELSLARSASLAAPAAAAIIARFAKGNVPGYSTSELLSAAKMLQSNPGIADIEQPTIGRDTTESLAKLGADERELAVRLLPFVEESASYVHEHLRLCLENDDTRLRVAALQAIQQSRRLQHMLGPAGIDSIIKGLGRSRQLRMEGISTLVALQRTDQFVLDVLATALGDADEADAAEIMVRLAPVAHNSPIRALFVARALALLDASRRKDVDRRGKVMEALASTDGIEESGLADALLGVARTRGTSAEELRSALRALPAIVPPTARYLERIVNIALEPQVTLRVAAKDIIAADTTALWALWSVVDRSRRQFAAVPVLHKSLVPKLPELNNRLDSLLNNQPKHQDFRVALLRKTIQALDELRNAYEEFAT